MKCYDCGNKEFVEYNESTGLLVCSDCGQFYQMKLDEPKAQFKAGMLAAAEIISRECSGDESSCCCNETTETIKAEAEKL